MKPRNLLIVFTLLALIATVIYFKSSSHPQSTSSPAKTDSQKSTIYKSPDTTIIPTTGDYAYANTKNNFQTAFKSDPLSAGAIQFKNSLGSIAFATNRTQSFGSLTEPENTSVDKNSLTYAHIFPGLDVRYTLSPTRLLEEFVVADAETATRLTTITQTAETAGVDSYKEDSGALIFSQGQTKAFVIPRPVLYEAGHPDTKSYGISYTVKQQAGNAYTISKVISPEGMAWLRDPRRVYPIVIDLVIDNADTASNWVSSDTANTVVSQETTLKQEGTGSVKVQTTGETTTTVDLMEYANDTAAQAAYATNSLTSATGGTITSYGGNNIHTFTGGGTFTPNGLGNVDYLIVAGGGGGGGNGDANDAGGDGGGGGGGMLTGSATVSAAGYGIGVGGGGGYCGNGGNSSFNGLTAIGGGHGAGNGCFGAASGGSGGGGSGDAAYLSPGGGTGGQGNTGGWGWNWRNVYGNNKGGSCGGGGGGAGGGGGGGYQGQSGGGGGGGSSSISGSAITYAGGGGAGNADGLLSSCSLGAGGSGGGGAGGASGSGGGNATYYGGGGGGDGTYPYASHGGSGYQGIVIVSYSTAPALQSYSEATVKSQGSYALRGSATATTSLGQSLTRTIGSPLNLSAYNTLNFDLRSTRTGSNIKIGLHDTGGTTTEITPNITSANVYQAVSWDISGVANANKDAIDKIIITVVDAASANTFYLDNMSATGRSLNSTVTLTTSPTDLSTYSSLAFWVRSTQAGSFIRFQFGENASTEQTSSFTINSTNTWELKTWNISGITGTARNAVTKYAFQFTADTLGATVYFDNIATNMPPNVPTLDSPGNAATALSLSPLLKTTTTDPDGDYMQYKIVLCTNSLMTIGCQTFDQTSSQTGWSGQNAQTSTAYTSGTQGVYAIQTPLAYNTTYYWDTYAIDPGGSNIWSSTQGTPNSFTTLAHPTTPILDLPTNASTDQSLLPALKLTATDNNGDYIRYKIFLCTSSNMSTGCQSFDQTSSQTGWSGQNAQTGTAYTSGTQATYTVQSLLLPNTTYYWQGYAIDPGGNNTWSGTQATPSSFTTTSSPTTPTYLLVDGQSGPTNLSDPTPYFSAIHNDPDNDSANKYQIQVNTVSDFTGTSMWDSGTVSMTNAASGARSPNITYAGTTLNISGTRYFWRIRFTDTNNAIGAWSSVQSFSTIENALACRVQETPGQTTNTILWTDNGTSEIGYEVQRAVDGGSFTVLHTGLAANSATDTDATISSGHSYQYRVAPYYTGSVYGPWCTTTTLSLQTGSFRLD